jgi:hypothetical protein
MKSKLVNAAVLLSILTAVFVAGTRFGSKVARCGSAKPVSGDLWTPIAIDGHVMANTITFQRKSLMQRWNELTAIDAPKPAPMHDGLVHPWIEWDDARGWFVFRQSEEERFEVYNYFIADGINSFNSSLDRFSPYNPYNR